MSTLYQNLIGEEFNQLAPLLQRFHTESDRAWNGEAKITWNKNPLLRILLWMGGLPKEADNQKITVRITPEKNCELWLRKFGNCRMVSKQKLTGRSLRENFGPFSLVLDSHIQQGALHQSCPRSDFLGVPLPSLFALKITAHEWQENEHFNFDVKIGLASLTLIHYRGWLLPDSVGT